MKRKKARKGLPAAEFLKQLSAYSAAAGMVLLNGEQAEAGVRSYFPAAPINIDKGIDLDRDGVQDFFFAVATQGGYPDALQMGRANSYNRFDAEVSSSYSYSSLRPKLLGARKQRAPVGSCTSACSSFVGVANKLAKGARVRAAMNVYQVLLMDAELRTSGTTSYTTSSLGARRKVSRKKAGDALALGSMAWGGYGKFNNGAKGYLGVKFRGHGDTDYNGWILFAGGTKPSLLSGKIVAWGYENTGAAINAGAAGTVKYLPIVKIATVNHYAFEGGGAGSIKVTRVGSTTKDLTVAYAVEGTAANGADYALLSGKVVIKAGNKSATIKIKPVNDALVEGSEEVVIRIKPKSAYLTTSQDSAVVYVIDND